MQEKILNIIEVLNLKIEFDRLLKTKSQAIFRCDNQEFIKNYSDLYKKLKKCYKFVFGIELSGSCSQNFLDRYFQLKEISLQKLINMANINHKLKKDTQVYWIDGDPYSWQSVNITNEICEKIYLKYGAAAFEFYDVNWKKEEQITVQEVQKVRDFKLKEYFVDGKAPQLPEAKPVVEHPKQAPTPKQAPKKQPAKKAKK